MRQFTLPCLLAFAALASCKSTRGGDSDEVDSKNADQTGVNGIAGTVTGTVPGESVDHVEDWKDQTSTGTESSEANPLNPGDGVNVLKLDQTLSKGQSLQSLDGRFQLILQNDANLVLLYKNRALWSSDTANKGAETLAFLATGNLVLRDSAGKTLWSSQTADKNAALLRLNNDGSLTVVSKSKTVLWNSGTCCYPAEAPADSRRSIAGMWSSQGTWPLIPLHMVMLPTGKVFTFGTDEKGEQGAGYIYDVWNPERGLGDDSHNKLANTQKTDTFCSAPTLLATSGNVIIPGGDTREPKNRGIRDTLFLDKSSQALSRGPYLANARWYATSTNLPNGEVLIYGGTDGDSRVVNVPEIYNPTTNRWRSLMGAANNDVMNGGESKWFYPRQWVAPNGKIFGMTGEVMYWLNTAGGGSVAKIGNLPDVSRSYISAAVMYAPGKILQMGGSFFGNIGSRASDGAVIVDINGNEPKVTRTNPMAFERAWVNATVLPNGEVLATGGSAVENQMQSPGYTAELWSPDTQSFRPLAKSPVARLYHSASLLLQDGSVLVGGGGAPGPLNNLNVEIFYPPYLFDASNNFAKRPVIQSAPSVVAYDARATVTVDAPIQKVALVRLGATTHSFDMGQRFIPLSYQVNGLTLNVQFPANANLAPPGYYHLFVLNANGVPSISRIVSMGVAAPAADAKSKLDSGERLGRGESLVSADGRFRLSLQADQNLVLYQNDQAIWTSGTQNSGAESLRMEGDGNLQLYGGGEQRVWSSNTAGNGGGRLEVQSDGNVVLYKGTQAYWATGTCCR